MTTILIVDEDGVVGASRARQAFTRAAAYRVRRTGFRLSKVW